MRRTIVGICALALVAGACSSGKTPAANSPTPSATSCALSIASTAKLAFVAPGPNQSVPANHVEVKLKLTGGIIVPPGTSCDIKPNQGHVHIELDGKVITIAAGLDVVVNDIETSPGHKLGPLSPGIHTLYARYVDSAHIPFNPPVNAGPITFRAS